MYIPDKKTKRNKDFKIALLICSVDFRGCMHSTSSSLDIAPHVPKSDPLEHHVRP